ncbi:hypothetical protein SCB71_06390 [Herbiconiux sp. KACC 21604]|uniref:hypothetical protein n=1 Tax=unclassified Herbiconiux TaxID=2618217 RepID=UPI001492D688|nr:hypothetical protein [Herbiconiux sp. SALV-R1]QJU52945.1 hypothetical protein HL652_04375 [Herbiconiux sp. SALV-R1]WPO87867.1 hypothetical protein SCB71_06390 [Herbiconiux sp. KACC 21604]
MNENDETKGIRVTIEDLEEGTSETKVIWNDYLLIAAGDRYLANVNAHGNGTHVLTVKRDLGAVSS